MEKVLVIHTGGTIAMEPNEKGELKVSNTKDFVERLRHKGWQYRKKLEKLDFKTKMSFLLMEWDLKEEKIELEIKMYISEPMDSTKMKYEDWKTIANIIKDHYKDFKGFVVLHGTDTMAYTASALSFMFDNLKKPVVLTGSQIPICKEESDGVNNFKKAVLVAGTLNIPEVTICFDNKLFRGNRTRKRSITGLDAFESPNFPHLAVFSGNRRLYEAVNESLLLSSDGNLDTELKLTTNDVEEISGECMVYTMFPGISDKIFDTKPKSYAVILRSFGPGNIPPDICIKLKNWKLSSNDDDPLVVNVSQCEEGGVTTAYAIGAELDGSRVVSGGDMTFEAVLTKLFIACMLKKKYGEKKEFFEDCRKGERTIEHQKEEIGEEITE